MRWPTTAARSPIGLDLGAHALKAAQLARGGGPAVTVSLPRASADGPLTAADLVRLRDVLVRRGFVGRDVVVSIPSASLLSGMLELPARAPGVPLEQIARAEFGRVHKQDPAAVTMTSWDLPAPARASKATYVMAVGGPSAAIDEHLDLIEAAGFRVSAVDDPASATARAVAATADPDALTAVLDWGWSAATLIVLRQRVILYVRRMPEAGVAAFRRACLIALDGNADLYDFAVVHPGLGTAAGADVDGLAEVDDVLASHLADLCKDVGQAFGYLAHQYPDASARAVTVVGGGGLVSGVAARVRSLLGVEARVDVAGPSTDTPPSPAVNAAVGLATFGRRCGR